MLLLVLGGRALFAAADGDAFSTSTSVVDKRSAQSAQPPTALPANSAGPVRLRIPALKVLTPLERLGVSSTGELRTPRNPAHPGWYVAGPVPGELGAAVIAGHVDSTRGPAVFWRLAQLGRGDRIVVDRSDGTAATFAVTEVRHVQRRHFPTREVYGPTPDVALRLITCGGSYDHEKGRYRQNIVVFALAVTT